MAESYLHFGAIRLRLTGVGNLVPYFIGLDNTIVSPLTAIPMSYVSGKEPTRLANAKGQRMRLKLTTTQVDEFFQINRLVVFVKELWQDIPTVD
jgi:hypothetical protein